MNYKIKNNSGIISAIMILLVLVASGWISYGNLHAVPASDNGAPEDRSVVLNNYEQTASDISASDISASDTASSDTAATELTGNSPGNTISSQTSAFPEEEVKIKYIVIKKATNVRAEDSDTSKKLTTLMKGDEVELLSESKTRYKVRYAGSKTGWIIKACGDITEKKKVIKHIPVFTSGDPISMKGTKEGDDIAAILKKYATTGASVAVIKNGAVAYTYEYGYANKQKKIKVNENTKFRIASVTKVFTSMLAMSEVDDEKLDLDASLTDIMGYRFRHPSYPKQNVTMRMLLTHTSGLIDRDKEYGKKLSSITNNRDYYVSPPGVKFLYCNLGMGIAGAVVEKSADQTISQYAKEKFFDPMGIDASFDAKYLSDKSLVAECYTGDKVNCSSKYLCRSQERGKPGNTFHLGQGGLLISSADLARVTTILINEGQYNGKQYLSQHSLSEMLKDQKIETGKGFQQCIGIRKSRELIKDREMYFHNGASYGIFSLMAFDPADKSGIVIITSGAFTKRNKNTVFAICDDIMNYSYQNIIK